MPPSSKTYQHEYEVYLRCKANGDFTAKPPDPATCGLGEWEANQWRMRIEAAFGNAAKLPLARLIDAARREVSKRRSVYPKQVAAGRMSQAEADRHLAEMLAIYEYLAEQKAKQ